MLQTVASTSRLPAVLLSISLKERLLIALHDKPLTMPQLCQVVASPSKQTYRVIDQMRHEHLVRRLGVRRSTFWCLATWHGRLPKREPTSGKRKRTVYVKPPEKPSWWLVAPDQFAAVAHARIAEMGWDK